MAIHWMWQTVLIFVIGTLILRIGGRKSISQMTISQTIVMIGLGSLLIQPVAGKGLMITFLAAMVLTVLMILSEYLAMKVDFLETIITGKSVIVIEDGQLNINNLKKLRLSVDKLETRLRQSGISSIDDVKYATIEISGQLGYELKDHKKPLTREDFINLINSSASTSNDTQNIFQEIKSGPFEQEKNEP